MHAGDPGDTAYLPRPQSAHASAEELPAGLVVPDGQSSHSLLPAKLKLPAGHSKQSPEKEVAGPLRPTQPSTSRELPAIG